jgi:ribonuclease HI
VNLPSPPQPYPSPQPPASPQETQPASPIPNVKITTDGSGTASGPGGWAAIIRCGGKSCEVVGSELEATNNSMEIMAAVMGLAALKMPCRCEITTDSEYVLNGATYGLPKWRRSGWMTNEGAPVKNRKCWEILAEQIDRHVSVSWVWVRGHSGHPDNERCDFLASEAREKLLPPKEAVKKSRHGAIIRCLEKADPEVLREAIAALGPESRARLREFLGV